MPRERNDNAEDSYFSESEQEDVKVEEVNEPNEEKTEIPPDVIPGTVAYQELERKRKEADESKRAYEDGKQFEIDIARRKNEIIADDKKKNKRLNKHFEKRASYDGGKGLCLCKIENETSVKIITIMDMILFFNIPRCIAACMVRKDHTKAFCYHTTRVVTFWIQTVILFGASIGWIFMQVLEDKTPWFVYILIGLAANCLILVMDFHFTRVIEYYARQTPRREKRLKQEAEEQAKLVQEEKSRYPSIDKIIGEYEETDKKNLEKTKKNGYDKNGKKVGPPADDGGIIRNRSMFKLTAKPKEKDIPAVDEESPPKRKKSKRKSSSRKKPKDDISDEEQLS